MKRRRLIAAAVGGAVGLLFAVGLFTGGPLLWIGLVLWVLIVGWALYVRHWRRAAPERYRRQTLQLTDPDAGPPPGARRVDEPVVQRWQAAASGLDPAEYAALLTEDFTYRTPLAKRPLSRERYLRSVRVSRHVLAGPEGRLEEMWGDPGEADLVWVRLHARSRPPGHAEIDVARWERWTLTPDRERIRAIELVAYATA